MRYLILEVSVFYLTLIIFAGIGSASVCDPSQQLFSVSSITNAHGAVYSDVAYTTKACFSDYFNGPYTGQTGLDPHVCTGANFLFGLSSKTNAHAAAIVQIYPENVCYGDLACEIKTTCSQGQVEIASLSSLTNAHLSLSGNYPNKVCCRSSVLTKVGCVASLQCGPVSAAENPCTQNSECTNPAGYHLECQGNNMCVSKSGPIPAGAKACTYATRLTDCAEIITGDCGNGILNPSSEDCDGNIFKLGIDCSTYGYNSGFLGCFAKNTPHQCTTDKSNCYNNNPAGTCGDGIRNQIWEDCDGVGDGLKPKYCASAYPLIYISGMLGCYAKDHAKECHYDITNCVPVTPQTAYIREVFWTDLNNGPKRDSGVNYKVRLLAQAPGFPNETVVQFRIFENDSKESGRGEDDLIKSVFGKVVDGMVESFWQITMEDYKSGGDESEFERFYFIANVSDKQNVSGNLNVYKLPPPPINVLSVINGPHHRQIYFNGTNVSFEGSSVAYDLPITSYHWTVKEDDFSSDTKDFNYTLNKPGFKTITLRVSDGYSTDEMQIAILATAGPGMIAYVDTPYHLETINKENNRVDFSAVDSYVINNSLNENCVGEISCVAGNCPTSTRNIPALCETNIRKNITLVNKSTGFKEVIFNWTFNGGFKIDGVGTVNGWKNYDSQSNHIGDKWIHLLMNYTNETFGSLSNMTIRNFTIGQCIENREKYLFINSKGKITNIVNTLEGVNCKGQDGIAGPYYEKLDDCCRSGMKCDATEGCIFAREDKCADYQEENPCNVDEAHAYLRDPRWDSSLCTKEEINDSGVYSYSCKCKWKEDKCKFVTEAVRKGGGGNGPVEDCTEFTCESTSTQSDCQGGQSILSTTNKFISTGAGYCGNTFANDFIKENCPEQESYSLSCGKDPVILPFFEASQIAFVIVLVLVIHFIFSTKKRIKGGNNKN